MRRSSSSTSLAVPSLSRLVVPFLLLFVLAAPANAMEKCDSPLKVLVTGASGYLGQFLLDAVLAENASPAGRRPLDVAGTYSTRPKGIPEGIRALKMDLADAKSVEESLSSFAPDVVINLAAMSAPLACEKNKDEAAAINVPSALLSSMLKTCPDALLIHVSTDQIFDGDTPVYSEGHTPAPVNQYGATKLRFEQEVRNAWANHLILRSSLIYGAPPPRECARAGSFLQFLDGALGDPAKDAAPLDLFADEVRCPVFVEDVVALLLAAARGGGSALGGGAQTLHMGGPERMSRVDMAKGVCSHRGYPEGRIKHSSRAALDLGFTSPLDISMDSSLLDSQPWAIAALPQGRTTWAAALHKVLV